jgi:putative hydrolase of the HAD superfamily
MTYSTLLLDLDDTLYPSTTGIWDLIGDRINLYMQQRVKLPAGDVSNLRESLFHKYGTTLRGLQIEYGIDPVDYLDFVHQVHIEMLISPDPWLNQILAAYPLPKWIFTNASRAHAMRVLRTLQIESLFTGVIDILDIAPFCKPMPEAFQLALQKAGIPDARSCILVDDAPRNLIAARQLGMYTIQVGNQQFHDAHARIDTIHNLPSALPNEFMEAK